MSHNDPVPPRAASNHWPAIIAILVALGVAAAAFLWFTADAPPPGDATRATSDPASAQVPAPADPASTAPAAPEVPTADDSPAPAQ
ncbi:hypothetical protein [Paracoccus jiaweipingae]|uniref:hypothetical protein n=1 Tax=unclassified Paracoccus (in: a-proteobacteria) TaxID=2688777 RepID=UPI0037A3BD74